MRSINLLLLVGCVLCAACWAALLPLPTSAANSVPRATHATSIAPESGLFTQPQITKRAGAPVPPANVVAEAWRSAQVIVVSRDLQWLWAFQNGRVVFSTPVTTGRPGLETPGGVFHVQSKATRLTFISPWPVSSPNYYAPEHVNYALFFQNVGYYIHDAPWREVFGAGSNLPHVDPDGTAETGSHGCVNVPTAAGATLYSWAQVGATIVVL